MANRRVASAGSCYLSLVFTVMRVMTRCRARIVPAQSRLVEQVDQTVTCGTFWTLPSATWQPLLGKDGCVVPSDQLLRPRKRILAIEIPSMGQSFVPLHLQVRDAPKKDPDGTS